MKFEKFDNKTILKMLRYYGIEDPENEGTMYYSRRHLGRLITELVCLHKNLIAEAREPVYKSASKFGEGNVDLPDAFDILFPSLGKR